ncbi:HD domain-containing phosphohydrolase [Halanaerobium hydrogeniformans]|nr:HD domain-containing phosphohydrolase [Halanaerobium hydrogeniformans]
MNKVEYNRDIPVATQAKWQKILNILVKTADSSDALITRFDPPFLDVFKASENIENIFKEGMRVKVSGHYCYDVIKNDKKIMIVNALENKKWKDYTDAQSGFNAYLGYPLKWPDGKIFGTLCIHYKKAHSFSEQTQEVMGEFKELIESQLEIIDKNKKNEVFQLIHNNIKQGVCLHKLIYKDDKAVDYKIMNANPAYEKILGIPLKKAKGSLGSEIYKNDKAPYLKTYSQVAETGESLTIEKYFSPLNRYFNITVTSPEKGKFITLFEDITERKEKEEKISEQKEQLSVSFEQLSAYNEEVMAMNEELEQSFEEVNLLNQRFVNMIELVSNMGDKTLLSKKEFFSDLLKKAIEIIPEADYGKLCIINDQGKCQFIDAVGHDIKALAKIAFDKNLLFNIESKDINESQGYFFNLDMMESDKKELFLKALKPIKSSLYINIVIDEQTFGRIGLDIKNKSSLDFSDTTKKVLKSFSTLASSFFAFKRFDDLQTNFTKELLTSIIKIMEMYDLYTKGHSENVAKLASAIAGEMKLSKKAIKDTYWAGLVHDIGKLLIPLNIINKQEKLTDQEYELIKKHPVWGNKALSSSKILKPIAYFILHHHERWDGRGYPEGLEENEIPLISQILAVADAWDAMLSKRAYRQSLSFEEALGEIKKNKETQFSPQVVDAFVKILEDDKIETLQQDVLDNAINKSKNSVFF